MKNKFDEYYFQKYIQVMPFSLALWRAREAAVIAYEYAILNHKKLWEKFPQKLNFQRPILDLGCGFGEFSGVFIDSQIEMGIDINIEDLVKADKTQKYKQLQIADARKLPFKQNSFFTVLSISVLEHIPKTNLAIKEAYRVLKNDGLFIFTVPTIEMNNYLFFPKFLKYFGMDKLADFYLKKFHQVFKHINILSDNKWLEMTRKAGFKILLTKGTMAPVHLAVFDLFLISAFPSQIFRWLFGIRGVWALSLKSKITEVFYKKMLKAEVNNSNILVIAQKK